MSAAGRAFTGIGLGMMGTCAKGVQPAVAVEMSSESVVGLDDVN